MTLCVRAGPALDTVSFISQPLDMHVDFVWRVDQLPPLPHAADTSCSRWGTGRPGVLRAVWDRWTSTPFVLVWWDSKRPSHSKGSVLARVRGPVQLQ